MFYSEAFLTLEKEKVKIYNVSLLSCHCVSVLSAKRCFLYRNFQLEL